MINSSVSGVSGFNANAYTMTVTRAKRETLDESAPKNGLQAADYWTPDRMKEAVPLEMGRVVPGTGPEIRIPKESELPVGANPDTVSGSVPQLDDYWTPDRMQDAAPPEMGREVPQPEEKPYIPMQSELLEEAEPGGTPGSAPQLDKYWTPGLMQEVVPSEMGRVVPETGSEIPVPEESELPVGTNLDTVSGSVPQIDDYWTPERMRDAVPPDMGRVMPEPGTEKSVLQQHSYQSHSTTWQQSVNVRA